MSIYEDVIAAEQLIDQAYDLTTGEIDEQQEAQAQALKSEILSQGLETLCKVRVNRMAEIDALRAEEIRISDKRHRLEKSAENLERYIYELYQHGESEIQQAGTFTLSTRKSYTVETTPDFFDDRFIRIKQEIDKSALKKTLQAGEIVNGASLKTKYNLQIR